MAAQERGWKARGVEPSAKSVRTARRKLGLDVVEGTLKDLRDNARFDVITMINVLDQSEEPWRELDEARGLLKDRGVIFIRVPNGQLHSLLVRVGARVGINDRFRKYLVFHEYSFTAKFLRRLLRDKGFKGVIMRSSPPSQGDIYNLFVSSEAANA